MNIVDHDTDAGRFTTEVDGIRAVLEYQLSDGTMSITHTVVPPAIGGRGVAADLMQAALRAAHASGWRVHPVCSFAVNYMRKHTAPDPRHGS